MSGLNIFSEIYENLFNSLMTDVLIDDPFDFKSKLGTSVMKELNNLVVLKKFLQTVVGQDVVQDCDTYNPEHNILEFFNILGKFGFTTIGKVILNIQYEKHYMRVTSRVAERINTYGLRNLENIREMSKLGRDRVQCPVFLLETKLL